MKIISFLFLFSNEIISFHSLMKMCALHNNLLHLDDERQMENQRITFISNMRSIICSWVRESETLKMIPRFLV